MSDDTPPPRISTATLAAQSVATAEEIDRFVHLGLIAGPDADGTHDAGDSTRVRLLKALHESGVPFDRLSEAVAAGRLSFDFAGTLVADAAALSAKTVAEACAEVAVAPDEFRRLMLAINLAAPPDDQLMRDDDLEILSIFARARAAGVSEDAILATLRTFAMAIRQVVEAQRNLFRLNVEEPMLATGVPYHEMFRRAAPTRTQLQRMGYRAAFLLQRRFLERAVFSNVIARFEEALDENAVHRPHSAARHALCFLDLSGFTSRTETLGDDHAARIAATLVEIAQAQATLQGGHLVKSLGDGAMLHFASAEAAVRAALAVIAAARARDLPPVRAGIAIGPVVSQDGDYYGRTVNRAARLMSVAAPDEVLVTAAVADDLDQVAFARQDRGALSLKGVGEAVRAFAVRLATA